jgi:hypothetical protein
MKTIAVLLISVLALACSGRHHDSDNSPLPSVMDQQGCQTCYPWTGHGEAKVICSPLVDTCQIDGVCYFHCAHE